MGEAKGCMWEGACGRLETAIHMCEGGEVGRLQTGVDQWEC